MADKALGPGSVIARRFRLEDLLDEHSGARFWRATDTALARNVAVHVLPSEDPRAAATLEAARRSATVTDPHLLRVLDAIQEGDHLHVVHEWGSGLSLDRMLEDGPLDARRAAWLVREVAEALCVAHRHGVAHGRLIPENVMLTELGAVKLVGFVVDGVLHGAAATAPDDTGGDVRNLGALLYAALTGRWPGSPESRIPPAPLENGRVLRPRQVRAGVPRPLDALCDELLDPAREGVATAQLVQRRLGEFLGDPVQGAELDERTSVLDRRTLHEALAQDPEATQALRFDPFAEPAETATGELSPPEAHTAAVPPVAAAADSTPAAPPLRVVPAEWGPDADTGSHRPVGAPRPAPGNAWIRRAAALGALLLVVLAAVVAYRLGSDRPAADDEPTSPGEQTSEPQPVEVAAASDFDPDGGGSGENPEQVPLALDGDPATAWQTKTYFDGPVLAPYRSGVGLLLDLGSETEVRDVRVQLQGEGYDVGLLAAPPETGAPASPEGLDQVAVQQGVGGELVLEPEEPVTTRYLVLWLTALPDTGDGFRGAVAEVVVRS